MEEEELEEPETEKYSVILQEEDYEEEDLPGIQKLEDNFEPEDPTPEIQGWESHNFFRIQ
jgi:hypothetical protein